MRVSTIMKSVACTAVATVAFGGLGLSAAHAGEVTGNGKSLKNPDGSLNGKSICAFSGLNDTYSGDPTVPDEEGFTRTQSWGQLDKESKAFLTSIGVSPGVACNPTRGEAEH